MASQLHITAVAPAVATAPTKALVVQILAGMVVTQTRLETRGCTEEDNRLDWERGMGELCIFGGQSEESWVDLNFCDTADRQLQPAGGLFQHKLLGLLLLMVNLWS